MSDDRDPLEVAREARQAEEAKYDRAVAHRPTVHQLARKLRRQREENGWSIWIQEMLEGR